MIEFARQIADKWNISQPLAEMLCEAFRKGASSYYLAEYRPEVCAEISLPCLWEIYDFLASMAELVLKKKRVINALKKAAKLTPAVEKRVHCLSSAFEIDDMLLPLRPNPRSRGQLSIKKGLGPFADLIVRQEEESASLEERAKAYIGKDPSLVSAADVLQGVKDVLAERFAYDDTVRAMAREFVYEDGYFEIVPKNRQDTRFQQYAGKQTPIAKLTKDELLKLFAAEERKEVRLRLCVQLFRITELLRHHFIQNPEFSGFDFLCEVIDDSWQRLLQPIVERDIKLRLRDEAETWAVQQVVPELGKQYGEETDRGAVCVVDASHPRHITFIVVSGHGELMGATSEKKSTDGNIASIERLQQFLLRHRPAGIVINDNEQAQAAEEIMARVVMPDETGKTPPVTRFKAEAGSKSPAEAEWVMKKYGVLLDNDTRMVYGIAIQYLRPLELVPFLGTTYYSVHPLQCVLSSERFVKIINRIVTDEAFRRGVLVKDLGALPSDAGEVIPPVLAQAIRSAEAKEPFTSKNDLLKVTGMTEVLFRNLAGFIVIPQSDDFRDRSLVHPDHYGLLEEAAEQMNISLDSIAADPEILRSFTVDDPVRKMYLEKKLISQVKSGIRLSPAALQKGKRKLKLTELKEGSIVSGKVTNITPFGVFVNINAVCDGLIHISQLADEYVESPEQIVALHDRVDVRILKVDSKKRRVSLSMRGLGNLGKKVPRVKPSQGQLDTLAEHFKNR
ncbi:MAG: S1 RNA-binding domain-containing protein [Chitinispirillaceae bacterium]|nr:S1 RNA-binding domain-containing protein [Chitinispirillaceae bacterium]